MFRKLLFVFVAASIFVACGGNMQQKQEAETVAEEETIEVTSTAVEVNDFQEKAAGMIGEEITIEGTIMHVCRHGGQKMFITADNPDFRVKITPGEEMAAFTPEMEGGYVVVTGVVKEIEEEMHAEGEEHEEDEDHENHYHKPQYSITAIEYTIKEAPAEEEPGDDSM